MLARLLLLLSDSVSQFKPRKRKLRVRLRLAQSYVGPSEEGKEHKVCP